MRAIRKWLHLSPDTKRLTIQVFALLIATKFQLVFFPLQRPELLGAKVSAPVLADKQIDQNYPQQVAWAVRTISKRLLRAENCLPEALVVRRLLMQKGIPADLRIGVSKGSNGELTAHAWVLSNGTIVIGGSATGLVDYVQVGLLD